VLTWRRRRTSPLSLRKETVICFRWRSMPRYNIIGSPGKCRVARGWWNYPGQPRGLVALQENCTAFLFHRIRPMHATNIVLSALVDGARADWRIGDSCRGGA